MDKLSLIKTLFAIELGGATMVSTPSVSLGDNGQMLNMTNTQPLSGYKDKLEHFDLFRLRLSISFIITVFFHAHMNTETRLLCVDSVCQFLCVPWQQCQYWTTAKDGLSTGLFDVLLPSVKSHTGYN